MEERKQQLYGSSYLKHEICEIYENSNYIFNQNINNNKIFYNEIKILSVLI